MKILLVHTPFNWRKPLTIISWLIRKATGSYWNHCAIMIRINGIRFIIESDIKGVSMLPFDNWVQDQEIAIYGIMDDTDRTHRLLTKVGRVGYSFKDLLCFMPIYLFTGQFYGERVDGYSNKPTCYEFAAWVLNLTDWYKMTPGKFENELKNSNLCTGLELIIKAKKL